MFLNELNEYAAQVGGMDNKHENIRLWEGLEAIAEEDSVLVGMTAPAGNPPPPEYDDMARTLSRWEGVRALAPERFRLSCVTLVKDGQPTGEVGLGERKIMELRERLKEIAVGEGGR